VLYQYDLHSSRTDQARAAMTPVSSLFFVNVKSEGFPHM
jgi:hypothetical protein